ncbi:MULTISPECIES: VOC family protein [unclassified Saccharothrix]|uniref:VOC family protein n=1 Tax=unclassified Saccharothrix TaxID=2593673 RepID=UPI00307D9628
MGEPLAPPEFTAPDWRVLGEGACAFFLTASFADAARLVAAIAEVDRHPDVDIRPDGVLVRLLTTTPDHCGLTTDDLDAAHRISASAAALGLRADPSALQTVQVTIDAMDIPAVMRFWRAVLDYTPRLDNPDEDLVDPRGRGTSLWFQQMDTPRVQRNRLHFDVWVPFEHAHRRIAAAIDAGGRLVTDRHAPAWWVLKDPEGNEVCIATIRGR